MTDRELLDLIRKHNLDLGLYPPMRMVDEGDVIRFVRPTELTIYGEKLMEFSRALIAGERERCARKIESLRDDHCKATESECLADGSCGCEFVAAWNDAIAAIRAQEP